MAKVDTKNGLLVCAQDLIQRVGVNAMSYQDLSDEIGIRKASIHYHFPKKEDLVVALLERCLVSYSARYSAIVDSDNHSHAKLRLIADIFEQSLREGKVCVVGMLSVEFQSLGLRAQQAVDASICSSSRIYEKIFIQAVAEGRFSAEQCTYGAGYGFFSFLLGAQALSRCSGGADAFQRAAQVYIDTMLGMTPVNNEKENRG